MDKAQFHAGLFFSAVKGLFERKPDNSVFQEFDGLFEVWYKDPEKKLQENIVTVKEWLDHYDIKFSGTSCDYNYEVRDTPTLIIRVTTINGRKKGKHL